MSGFWKWGFRASVKLHSGSDEKSPKINDSLTFNDFLKQELPIVNPKQKLWLNPLLFNGSLQTIYYATHNSTEKFLIYYGRELFTYKDEGRCSLDWIIPAPESKEAFQSLYKETLPKDSPRLHPRTRFFTESELAAKTAHGQTPDLTDPICVVLHGLAGGSHEALIRNLGQILTGSDTNWDVVVVNARGCCRTKITTGKLYHALSTDDVLEVLVELQKRYPSRPIYTVGFSFGALVLLNFLGEMGEKANLLVKAAVVIGCPWDLAGSARHLNRSLSGRYMFGPSLTEFLNKLVKSNLKELQEHVPEIFTDEAVKRARLVKKTAEWDDIFTCKTAGFDTVGDYYDAGSPQQRLHNISVPTLIINSTDDPAIDPELPLKEVEANSNLAMVETNLGGHLGFVKWSGDFWCVEVADDFINQFHRVTV